MMVSDLPWQKSFAACAKAGAARHVTASPSVPIVVTFMSFLPYLHRNSTPGRFI